LKKIILILIITLISIPSFAVIDNATGMIYVLQKGAHMGGNKGNIFKRPFLKFFKENLL